MLLRHFESRGHHRSVAMLATLTTLMTLWLASARPLAARQSDVTVSCGFGNLAGTGLEHGFYVTGYPGKNISQVTLGYTTNTPGLFAISLTARRGSFAGPLIGGSRTAVAEVGNLTETHVTFDFGGAPVSPGDTITFTQTGGELSSLNDEFGSLFYDAGVIACNDVFETVGTNPPLDVVQRQGVGITITEVNPGQLGAPCIPSDTVLCVDDSPGDQRFRITASFQTQQGGGLSGKGQALPLAQLGATHGGLFWFFDQTNPEMLVKVINGCAVNDRYWAFISAGTNVGFTVTLDDTALANSKTYTNPDLTPAPPIQDLGALASCHDCTNDAQCPAGLLCCFVPTGRHACLPPQPGGQCPLFP